VRHQDEQNPDGTPRAPTGLSGSGGDDLYPALFADLEDVFLSLGAEGQIIWASPRVSRYGFVPSDLVDKLFISLVVPADHPQLSVCLGESGTSTPSEPYDIRIVDAGGQARWVQCMGQTAGSSSGGSSAIAVLLRDIHQRKQSELVMAEGLDMFREAQEVASIGSWSLDLVGGQLDWSPQIFALFGLDPAKFGASYEAFLEAIHPDDRERVNKAYTDSVQNKTAYDITHRLLRPDGEVRFVREHCRTTFDASGTPLRSTGTVQDVTQAQRAVLALAKSESKYRSLFDSALEMIHIVDDRGCIIDVNQRELDALGYERDAYIGRSLMEIIHPDSRAEAARCLKALFGGEEIRGLNLTLLTSNGDKLHVEVNAVPEMTGTVFVSARSVMRDVSARVRAEATVERERRFTDSLIDRSPGIFFLYQLDGDVPRLVRWNDNHETDLGYSSDELLGKHPLQFFVSEQQRRVGRALEMLSEDKDVAFEAELLHRTGETKPYRLVARGFGNAGKRYFFGFGIDVSGEVRARTEHRATEERFDTLFRRTPVLMALLDIASGTILDINDAYTELLGFTAQDVVGIPGPAYPVNSG